jgi:hypothetical protein
MLRLVVTASAVVAVLTSVDASALTRIQHDRGGEIGQYLQTFVALRNSAERVMIDGACLSACTMVLGLIPRSRICVTERALLGFHAAWTASRQGLPVKSALGTQTLWEIYPQDVKRWLVRKGGLQTKMIFLSGHELANMYAECQ